MHLRVCTLPKYYHKNRLMHTEVSETLSSSPTHEHFWVFTKLLHYAFRQYKSLPKTFSRNRQNDRVGQPGDEWLGRKQMYSRLRHSLDLRLSTLCDLCTYHEIPPQSKKPFLLKSIISSVCLQILQLWLRSISLILLIADHAPWLNIFLIYTDLYNLALIVVQNLDVVTVAPCIDLSLCRVHYIQ